MYTPTTPWVYPPTIPPWSHACRYPVVRAVPGDEALGSYPGLIRENGAKRASQPPKV